MNTSTNTNPSSIQKRLQQAQREIDNPDASQRAIDHAAGEARGLQWLLDQDPIALSGEDRERIAGIARTVERHAPELKREAEILRNLAAGQGGDDGE